jgi:hypothetical protein
LGSSSPFHGKRSRAAEHRDRAMKSDPRDGNYPPVIPNRESPHIATSVLGFDEAGNRCLHLITGKQNGYQLVNFIVNCCFTLKRC